MPPYLDAVPGKLRDGFRAAQAWFAAAPGAQQVNARISLAEAGRHEGPSSDTTGKKKFLRVGTNVYTSY